MNHLQSYTSSKSAEAYPCCWIVRDPHQGNWLIEGNQVSGFVDFAAASVDWFGWDVVRFLSSFVSSHEQIDANLQIYIDELKQLGLATVTIEKLREPESWTAVRTMQTLLSINQWCQWSRTRGIQDEGLRRWASLIDRAATELRGVVIS